MKKLTIFILVLLYILIFAACDKSGNESLNESNNLSDTEEVSDDYEDALQDDFNTVVWEGSSYKVNPVLSDSDDIDYVDVSEKDGVICVEFWWNYTEIDDGYYNALLMYYDSSQSQDSSDSVICSAYYVFNEVYETTKWSYFDKNNDLIYYTIDYLVYDAADNQIGSKTSDGTYLDLNGDSFDITTLEPSLKVIDFFKNN